MKGLTNRRAHYSNRRQLNVVSTIKNNEGEITRMVVDMTRDEGTVIEEGTKLTAENLTKDLLSTIYQECFGIKLEGELSVIWSQVKGTLQKKEFTFNYADVQLYIGTSSSDFLSVAVKEGTTNTVVVTEKTALNNQTGAPRTDYFDVLFYTDSTLTNFLTKIKGKVIYYPLSVNPID